MTVNEERMTIIINKWLLLLKDSLYSNNNVIFHLSFRMGVYKMRTAILLHSKDNRARILRQTKKQFERIKNKEREENLIISYVALSICNYLIDTENDNCIDLINNIRLSDKTIVHTKMMDSLSDALIQLFKPYYKSKHYVERHRTVYFERCKIKAVDFLKSIKETTM